MRTKTKTARSPRRSLAAVATTLLELSGAAAITYGIWLIYQPAAFIVAGAAAIGISYIMVRGGIR